MLQVARLSPKLLDEASDRVVDYLRGQFAADGGVRDRSGASDLYYTVFGLDGLIAMQAEPPAEAAAAYLRTFGDGAALDLVHLACLARCWAALGKEHLSAAQRVALAARLEGFRSDDGGYAGAAGAAVGSAYHSFLALGAYQDLGLRLPDPGRLADSVAALRADDGGYGNVAGMPTGTTPASAAAVTLLRQLEAPLPAGLDAWFLQRLHPEGGFVAAPETPMPDLLSTATALHALSTVGEFPDAVREPCLDFVDTLWTGQGFCGHWADDTADAEYTFYGLLALGHLAV